MLAHGGWRDPEELGDLGVRLAADDPGKDLALARGQAELFARLLEEQRVAGAIDRETAVTTLSSHRSRAHLQPVRECGWKPRLARRSEVLVHEPACGRRDELDPASGRQYDHAARLVLALPFERGQRRSQPPAGLRCAPEVAEMGLEQIEHEPVAFREVSSRAPVEQER